MKLATAEMVSKMLNFAQKQRCMVIDQEWLTTFNDDPYLLKTIITDDESLVYG